MKTKLTPVIATALICCFPIIAAVAQSTQPMMKAAVEAILPITPHGLPTLLRGCVVGPAQRVDAAGKQPCEIRKGQPSPRANATLTTDGARETVRRIATRYVGDFFGEAYAAEGDNDTLIRIESQEIRAWDFKDDLER